jgi:hypothetical protein
MARSSKATTAVRREPWVEYEVLTETTRPAEVAVITTNASTAEWSARQWANGIAAGIELGSAGRLTAKVCSFIYTAADGGGLPSFVIEGWEKTPSAQTPAVTATVKVALREVL